eukprot:scaffold36583_cov63-Phaeocystis_antarctica.AAC.3
MAPSLLAVRAAPRTWRVAWQPWRCRAARSRPHRAARTRSRWPPCPPPAIASLTREPDARDWSALTAATTESGSAVPEWLPREACRTRRSDAARRSIRPCLAGFGVAAVGAFPTKFTEATVTR